MTPALSAEPETPIDNRFQRLAERFIPYALIAITLACYWPVGKFGFINCDDPTHVTGNRDVMRGLTPSSVRGAFTQIDSGYWRPVAHLSHMVDVQLFGLNAGWHHLHNLLIHTINTVLLWLILRRMTAATWPSAWVAAMFSIHPMHLESVAWIAERKDVLSTVFLLLMVLAYLHYLQRPGVGRYLLIVTAFVLGVATKPMIVTAPALLLVLDIWPLRRITLSEGFWRSLRRPVVEKLPLFALAAVGAGWTIYCASTTRILADREGWPLSLRLQTAPITYARYLRKLFWPDPLAIHYPMPTAWPAGWVIGAVALFVAITAAAVVLRRRPYYLAGWLWFVGMLMPVNGLVVAGLWTTGDRYTYVPYVGLFAAIAWTLRDTARTRRAVTVAAVVACGWLAACGVVTARSVWHWQNSLTVMQHALNVTHDNGLANTNYGLALWDAGRLGEAHPFLAEAARLDPKSVEAQFGYARSLIYQRRLDEATALVQRNQQQAADSDFAWTVAGELAAARGQAGRAITFYRRALELNPNNHQAHQLLAISLFRVGQVDEGEQHLQAALAITPAAPDVHHRLGLVAAQRNDVQMAEKHFQAAIRINPKMGIARLDYGLLLARVGRMEEALAELEQAAASLPPGDPASLARAHQASGKLLDRLGRHAEAQAAFASAVQAAERAVVDQPEDAWSHFQLAIVLRDQGSIERARTAAQTALAHARRQNNPSLVQQIEARFPEATATQPATTRPAKP